MGIGKTPNQNAGQHSGDHPRAERGSAGNVDEEAREGGNAVRSGFTRKAFLSEPHRDRHCDQQTHKRQNADRPTTAHATAPQTSPRRRAETFSSAVSRASDQKLLCVADIILSESGVVQKIRRRYCTNFRDLSSRIASMELAFHSADRLLV